MKIDATVVGRHLGGTDRVVGWRGTTNFAAAVGETAPCYLDDTTPDGLVAPPTFPIALTWPLLSTLGQRLGSGLPPGVLERLVHAGEHLRLHRPVRPRDRVAMNGQVVALAPGRSGARMVLRVDGTADDAPLFTEHVTVVFRGVECDPPGSATAEVPEGPAFPGDFAPLWQAMVEVGPEVPFVYDGCTGIVFPIHTSTAFARAAGLPGPLVQGSWTLARAVAAFVARACGGDPAQVREVGCRFTGMVLPGTRITVQMLPATPEGTHRFRVLDAAGASALEGWALLA